MKVLEEVLHEKQALYKFYISKFYIRSKKEVKIDHCNGPFLF